MLIFYSLLITFLIFYFLNIIGNFFLFYKFEEQLSKKIIFGYSIFSIITYNLYFLVNFTIKNIIVFWFFSIILIFIFTLFKKKKFINGIHNFFFLIPAFVIIIYILPAYLIGEQFYVFRGNHWDLFSYLSISSLFNTNNFNNIDFDGISNFFLHFNGIETLIYSRPLTSLILAIFLNIKFLDVYFLVYLFKSILVALSTIALKYK